MQPVSSIVSSSQIAGPSVTSSEKISSFRFQHGLALMESAASVVEKGETLKAFPLPRNERMRQNLEPFCRILSKMYYPNKQDKLSQYSRVSQSILMWDTLKYSLMSMETASRCGKTRMTPNYGLNAMYEELKSSTGFVMSLLLKIVQSTRTKNALHVLQRFRATQLFAESVCSGISSGNASGTSGQGTVALFLLSFLDSFYLLLLPIRTGMEHEQCKCFVGEVERWITYHTPVLPSSFFTLHSFPLFL